MLTGNWLGGLRGEVSCVSALNRLLTLDLTASALAAAWVDLGAGVLRHHCFLLCSSWRLRFLDLTGQNC